MDVADWLRGLGLDRYMPAFRDNDIDGEVLRRLTAEDQRELSVASIGHRRRLVDAIAALGAEVPTRTSPANAPSAAAPSPTLPRLRRREGWGGSGAAAALTVMFCDLVGSTELSARSQGSASS